ncbi:TPA: PIN domain-containing protein [Vibrio cholerae]
MKAIFFDTNIFYVINFDVDHELMTKVVDLANKLEIRLWISPITIEEIKAGIDKKLNDLLDTYESASKLLKYTVEDKDLFDVDLVNRASGDLKEQLEIFIQQHKFRVLDYSLLDDSDVSKIFQDYFHQTGAFTPKRSRKKTISKEFPDAFQIELLRRAVKCGDNIAIVSNDNDFAQALINDRGINVYKSLESIYKTLCNMWNESDVEITYIENRVLYLLDDFESKKTILSHLNFHDYNDVTETDITNALHSLYLKKLIDIYRYCSDERTYVKESNYLDNKEMWYKERI